MNYKYNKTDFLKLGYFIEMVKISVNARSLGVDAGNSTYFRVLSKISGKTDVVSITYFENCEKVYRADILFPLLTQ